MNSKDLYYAIGKIDDDVLEKSEVAANAGKGKYGWLKWGAVAACACLCLVTVGAVVWRRVWPSHMEGDGVIVSENGVTIPPMNVSIKPANANVSLDMLAFFVYQDRCYVQNGWVYDDVDIVGEYLGTSDGWIDEWMAETGYEVWNGSVKGDFYAVKGYDPGFMLCMKGQEGDVSIYICNNGITLKYGSELYEDRLHLSGNIKSVQYESRDSWYFSREERYQMDGIPDIVLDFIKGMDSAEFIPCDSVPLGVGQNHMADTELYHMYFKMEDGTTIHLRLHENGYVRLDGLWAVCVQVPEESYNALLDLLDNHVGSTAVEAESIGLTLEDCQKDADLGKYVPYYVPEDFCFDYATIYYYLDTQTADEIGTKEILLHYKSVENPYCYYTITITWADEYGKNSLAGPPMIEAAALSMRLSALF